jgi:hypothetical protein
MKLFKSSFSTLLGGLIVAASLLSAGVAMAQAEPTMNQIYAAAQAGKVDEAQVMVQQVLVSHPKSAKAFYVQSELYARQGRMDRSRESLATAEKLAPGLPFVKPDALQALRAQLSAKELSPTAPHAAAPAHAAPQSSASPTSWLMPLLLAGGVIAAAYFFFRRRDPQPYAQAAAYGNNGGLNGPQTFGSGAMQPAYPQQGYPQGYGQPAGSGLGGRIMGGVATGLAVGAGVMAAEAIGRNLMGGHNSAAFGVNDATSGNSYEPINTNADMGGNNFGMNDTSWDDGAGADVGGGGDWDN